jgi:hypothetical protein
MRVLFQPLPGYGWKTSCSLLLLLLLLLLLKGEFTLQFFFFL